MKNKTNHIACCLCLATVLSVLLLPPPAVATILTFTIEVRPDSSASLETVFTNYGDNVSSTTQVDGSYTYSYGQGNAFTPNISLSYSHSHARDLLAYKDTVWPSVAFLNGDADNVPPFKHYFTFTPDSGSVAVQVNSFDIFHYSSGTSPDHIQWFLHQDTTSGTVFDSGSGNAFFDYNNQTLVTTAGSSYQGTVVLEISHDIGSTGELGLDNLNFDQVLAVPEPSTMALVTAAGALAMLQRCRRRSAATTEKENLL